MGEADVDMVAVNVETDPEEAKKADDDNDGSVSLDTSELEAINYDQEPDPETVKKYLDKSQSDNEVSITFLKNLIEQYNRLQSDKRLNLKNLLFIISIMLLIKGRIRNQRALRMRKHENLVQCEHVCNTNTKINHLRFINLLIVF